MKRTVFGWLLACAAGSAAAVPIAGGQTIDDVTVSGKASIYQIFNHSGSTGGFTPTHDAVLFSFAAGAGNTFSFLAAGQVSCCSNPANTPPDGLAANTSIGGINGLSNAQGNTQLPLLGVFTTETDPSGGAKPAPLGWNAGAPPASLSPMLHQVFYIGDGRSGFNNPLGSFLEFVAPANATRLYLGLADASGFNAPSGYYGDNNGFYDVAVTMTAAIPEPGTYALLLAGLGLLGFAARRRSEK